MIKRFDEFNEDEKDEIQELESEFEENYGYKIGKDFIFGMWLMLQQDTPDDYVIATGETRTVRSFVEEALKAAELEGVIEDYVDFDEQMIRPSEVDFLVGDASKAKQKLGWAPKVDFEALVKLMVVRDLQLEQR